MGQVTLTYMLKESTHDGFKEAVAEMRRRIKAEKVFLMQSLETIWIEETKGHPIFFWDIVERANREGILTHEGDIAA